MKGILVLVEAEGKGRDGQMSRAPASHRESEDHGIEPGDLNPDLVKPMTLNLILVTS